MRLLAPSLARTWSAVATTASMKWSMSTAEARKLAGSPSAPRSRRAARCSRPRRRPFPGRSPPTTRTSASTSASCRRRPAPGRVPPAHRPRRLGGEPPVLRGGLVAGLPRPVQLVAQAPQPNPVGSASTVGDALVRQRVPAGWLAYSSRSSASATPRVPRLTAIIGSTPALPVQLDEFVQPELVGLDAVPGQVAADGAVLTRPDAVLPAVAGDEVAARVAHHRDAELLGQLEDVAAEPVLVGGRVVGLEDPGVHTAAQVLDERAEQPALDRRDPSRRRSMDRCGEWGSMAVIISPTSVVALRTLDCERSQGPASIPDGHSTLSDRRSGPIVSRILLTIGLSLEPSDVGGRTRSARGRRRSGSRPSGGVRRR